MSFEATAVIRKQTPSDAGNPGQKIERAALVVILDGKEYGPRYLGDYREVAVLLIREAGVTHEQLHEHFPSYQRGEEVRLCCTLENAEALKHLGLDAAAA